MSENIEIPYIMSDADLRLLRKALDDVKKIDFLKEEFETQKDTDKKAVA